MQFNLIGNEDGQIITVVVKGRKPESAHDSHPNFGAILVGAQAGDESVIDLFDVAATASTKFEQLTERISTSSGRLFLDGVEVNDAVAKQIVRFLGEGVEDWKPLVKFMDNVVQNPNEHSREQLYEWLARRDFTITEDGLIVGYKSVRALGDEQFKSISSGTAVVDGEQQTGRIKQGFGSVVTMPRDEVQHDPSEACHVGLHMGTWDYAAGFSGDTILEVHVNPRDVVSVPTDTDASKVRACRYVVVQVLDKPYATAVVEDFGRFDEVEDDCGCGDCCGYPECEDCHEELEAEATADNWGDSGEDVQPVDDLDDETPEVNVGDEFGSTDSRRTSTFKVESIEGDFAVGKSLPLNITRKVRLDRLTSRKYRKV